MGCEDLSRFRSAGNTRTFLPLPLSKAAPSPPRPFSRSGRIGVRIGLLPRVTRRSDTNDVPLLSGEDPVRRNGKARAMFADEPRTRLIEAALDLFGRYSFDGVSTRMLAEKAGVNLAAIKYYFGSKEGLYIAVAEYIVEQIAMLLGGRLERIRAALEEDTLSRERCFHLMSELLEFLVTRLLGLPQTDKWLGIIIREQLCPSQAFNTLFEGFMKPLDQVLFGLTARITGLDSDDQEVKLRVFAIVGQIMMFHIAPSGIRRTLAWEDYGPENLDAICSVIMNHLKGIFATSLTGEHADSDTGNGY